MKAIVLAGGLGTRMASLTGAALPKPMLDVCGRPFLAHHLDWLIDEGVETIVLAVHHLRQVIETHFGEYYRGVQIRYSRELQPMGTGGAIVEALALLPGEATVLITNGDTYFPIDHRRLEAFHLAAGADVTLALVGRTDAGRYGAVDIGPDGRVQSFSEKKPTGHTLINAGVYCVAPGALGVQETAPFSFERDFLQRENSRLAIYGLPFDEPFWDIGVPEDYLRFTREFAPCGS